MTVVKVNQFTVPKELSKKRSASVQGSDLSFDLRCSNCVLAFRDRQSLLQHCRDSGHGPVYASDAGDSAKPAHVEVFVSYTNLALQRAMGERLAKWGKVYIDPKAPLPAVDARGNDMGVHIFEAYSCTFGVIQSSKREGLARLALTCDLKAKVIRYVLGGVGVFCRRTHHTLSLSLAGPPRSTLASFPIAILASLSLSCWSSSLHSYFLSHCCSCFLSSLSCSLVRTRWRGLFLPSHTPLALSLSGKNRCWTYFTGIEAATLDSPDPNRTVPKGIG
jgi:hypothetical protein